MFMLIQNDPMVPAGSCSEILSDSGFPFLTVSAYRGEACPDPSRATGIIVLGGEMGVHDNEEFPHLARVRSFMADALREGIPLLGICLGGQLLSQVAGGSVASPSPHGEQGICRVELTDAGARDPLFAGVARSFVTFQLHNDSFTVPERAVKLAASAVCPAQAFRLGSTAYALQFHPEVDEAIAAAWGESSTPPVDFLTPLRAASVPFRAASRAILGNFLTLAAASR
jgi:GMP synthase (glutamine-hydrolysing)